jgi:hypothetical protein
MMRRLFSIPTLLCGIAYAATACGSDSILETNMAVGNYSAIVFTTSGASGQTNQLALGGTLTLNLAANGTTSGHLHTAASGSDPAFDADMAGTWALNGEVVTISQSADTFVRDMPFTLSLDPANGWILTGNQTFSGTNIQVTLKRT